MKRRDLVGQAFGRLTVVELRGRDRFGSALWLCRCECGGDVVVRAGSLLSGNSQSCGCLRIDRTRDSNTKHGMYGDPTYRVWSSMVQRCTNPKNPAYPEYGGRGITVCDGWSKFENFVSDMGVRPSGMSLDRRDNDKGYSKENCRWAASQQQVVNRRNVKQYEYNGRLLTLAEWSRELQIPTTTMYRRVSKAGSVEKALEGI